MQATPIFGGKPSGQHGASVDTLDPEGVVVLILRPYTPRPAFEPGRLMGYPVDPVAGQPVAAEGPLPQGGASGSGQSGLTPVLPAQLPTFPLLGVGDFPVASLAKITGAETAIGAEPLTRFATEDFTTDSTDPLEANTWFDGRIQNAGSVSRVLTLSSTDAAALVSEQGRMILNNADGKLDAFPDRKDLQGAEAVIAIARRGTRLDGWTVVATGRVVGVDITETEAELTFGGADYRLEDEYPSTLYKGTGGSEGTADLTDTRKPVLIGECYNVTPVLVNPLTYVFQVSAEPLSQVTAVRFGGAPFTPTVDYGTYALLNAASVATGFYATCLAEGFVKVGLSAGGLANGFTVTVDARGLQRAAPDIALSLADAARVALDVDVDFSAFTAIAPQFSNYIYGNYLTGSVTWRDLMNDLFTCMNAYWGVNRLGALTCGAFDIPDPADPDTVDLGKDDIISIDRLALPAGFEWPHVSRTLRFRKNWSVLSTTAAIVNNPRLGVEWRRYVARSTTLARAGISAASVDLNLQNYEAVEDLGNRLMRQHGVLRSMYSVVIPLAGVLIDEISQVRVTYPRFGLDTGRVFIVMATLEDYDARQVTLTLWG